MNRLSNNLTDSGLTLDQAEREVELLRAKAVVGIDPGLSGAVAMLYPDGRLTIFRDFKESIDIVTAVVRTVPDAARVVIEHVHAMPGQGVCSMFSFGRSTGIAIGAVLAKTSAPLIQVAPLRWQNHFKKKYGLAGAPFKEVTRDLAAYLFPKFENLFTRKKDHGSSDAALIALWGVENPNAASL